MSASTNLRWLALFWATIGRRDVLRGPFSALHDTVNCGDVRRLVMSRVEHPV